MADYYLFTQSNNVKQSIKDNLFIIAKKPANRTKLKLINHKDDGIIFSAVFHNGYNSQTLTKKQFEKAVANLDDTDKLINILTAKEANKD